MITVFRKIRQQLISTNRLSKYMLYAIGEILLVVIGILIALQVNNWNQERLDTDKQIKLLKRMHADIDESLTALKNFDTLLLNYETSLDMAIKGLDSVNTVQDLMENDKKSKFSWRAFLFKTGTFEEMLNTGSLYNLKNEELAENILSFYELIKTIKAMHERITGLNYELFNARPELEPFLYLRNKYYQRDFNLNILDTSWINNPNSSTYQALYKHYTFSYFGIIDRRSSMNRIINEGNDLMKKIDDELARLTN